MQKNQEQKCNKTTAAIETSVSKMSQTLHGKVEYFSDHVRFNTGFLIIYLLTVFNIKPKLPFWVRNNALN